MLVATPLTPSTYKMNVKLKEESFQCLLLCMPISTSMKKIVNMLMQTCKDLDTAKRKNMFSRY
jgi:hypothetical protein